MSTARSLVALVAAAAAVTGCSTTAHQAPRAARVADVAEPRPPAAPPAQRVAEARPVPTLTTFSDCDRFLQAVKQEAVSEVGPYGLPGGWDGAPMAADGVMVGATAAGAPTGAGTAGAGSADAAAMPAAAGASTEGFSTTNDQEAGVDEPDLAKTDGRLLVTVRQDAAALEVLGVDGDQPRRLGVLRLPRVVNPQLLLSGSLAVVFGTPLQPGAGGWRPETVADVVDLADPEHPHIVRTFRVPGSEVDARLIGGRVVVVVQRQPQLPWQVPMADGRDEARRVTVNNRAVIARSRLRDWLPAVTTTPSHRAFAPSCADTWHAATKQGLGTVSVVSFDPASEASVRQTTILGSASVVYASIHGLYLATTDWRTGRASDAGDVDMVAMQPTSTRIHAFDLTDPQAPRYVGSGVVRGQVTDQYALSEYDGDLRVATTVGTATPAPGEGRAPKALSDSRVTVLEPLDGALVQVGQIRGLGRGERIYGVRFLGTLAYVVTFRQIDPLYVLDLSDPRHPREVSHLEITGYSAYLHPLGDGLLLGLGRHVDSRAHPLGEQLSVFDVSQPAHPTLRSRLYEDGAYSPAEDDHHAFLWWAKDRLVVVPMLDENGYAGTPSMAVYHVDDAGVVDRVGSVSPPSSNGGFDSAQRSLVIGGVLYVVTDRGVLASRLHTLEQVAWLPYR